MLNKFFFSAMLLAAVSMMSFTAVQSTSAPITAAKGGNSLTVTNPGVGTVVLNWSISPATASYYIIIEDVGYKSVVYSGQSSQTNCTVYGLSPGTYRFTVGNGGGYIIIEDDIAM